MRVMTLRADHGVTLLETLIAARDPHDHTLYSRATCGVERGQSESRSRSQALLIAQDSSSSCEPHRGPLISTACRERTRARRVAADALDVNTPGYAEGIDHEGHIVSESDGASFARWAIEVLRAVRQTYWRSRCVIPSTSENLPRPAPTPAWRSPE